MTEPRWSLAIHGGAGSMVPGSLSPEQEAQTLAALGRALDAGIAVLGADGAALDAVEAAVRVLEDDPHFNAGRGAVFTYHGTNELDAAIMDGATRAAGAVAGVTHTRSPVELARAVMEHSPHVFLSGAGAEEFAREQQIEQVDPDWFATPERWRQLQELKAKKLGWFDVDLKYGTVGAVARDAAGHVAAATSTGGLTGKRWGRIGDSPVIGAGTYADDRSGAVSATGAGEFFIREGVAHEICARMRLAGEGVQQAADTVIGDVGALGGDGGVIVVGADGTTAFSFNTSGLYRGRADNMGLREIGIYTSVS
ncbi:isoaspartyl peptidase/L-asparaginase family protein [Novosphingobium lentum]|uniref:isoaspartyl peptidase/L-asparaginase family protein n=1 Tax=Novosphingobium lentum TaxID=145287 RepID=UPI0008366394|nr:isoaspartyl peptidase/L-asparaginase [Novosphingobium lentum]